MKKFLCLSAAALAMLGMASCSQEEAPVKDDLVRFNISLPAEVGSRVFSDGQKAVALTYAVYEHGSTTPIIVSEEEVTFTDLHASVEIKLVNGKSYDFVWWAATPNNDYYTFTPDKQTITVNYSKVVTNEENRDAFFQHTTLENVQSGFNETVILRRPFAQINIGTNDLEEAAVKDAFGADWAGLQTQITVPTYDTLNLMDGEVSNPVTVTFAPAGLPTGEVFPVAGYNYLSMDYILVGAQKENVNIIFSVLGNGAEPVGFNNTPVQRNYRTNIFGQMLTSTGNFEIIIDPIYNDPDYNEDFSK